MKKAPVREGEAPVKSDPPGFWHDKRGKKLASEDYMKLICQRLAYLWCIAHPGQERS